MYFKFDCPHCGKTLKVSEDKAGHKARCPYCHQSVTVPEPPLPEPPQEEAVPDRMQLMAGLMEGAGGTATEEGAAPPAEGEQAVAEAKPKRGRKKKDKQPKEGDPGGAQFAEGTEVSLFWTGLYGLIGAVWFYGLIIMLSKWRPSYYFDLFIARGMVPYWETFFMGWSMSILLAKWHKFRRQKESMLFDVLPTEIGQEINQENVDRFVEHVRGLPATPSESFLINRVLRGLVHFKIRKTSGEVSGMLSSQSDIDTSAVGSSYVMLKVFNWAIPILGFIGTVVGMSAAVGAFSGAMDTASDIGALKKSLNSVTSGLGVAFDTTYVALVMSMIITLWQGSLQKAEEDLLNWVDEYCNENLIKRLDDGAAQAQPKDTSSAAVAERIAAIQKDMAKIQESHVASLKGATALIQNHTQQVQQHMGTMVGQVETAMAGLLQRADKTQAFLGEQTRVSADELRRCLQDLAGGIESLNEALTKVGSQTVAVLPEPARRRGFSGFGRRPNNGG